MTESTQNHITKKIPFYRKPWAQSLAAIVIIFGTLAGVLYWNSASRVVEIENSRLEAPIINITPLMPGTLNALYVSEGDRVAANAPIGLVGSETLFAKEGGLVLAAPRAIGSYYAPGQKVLSIIVDTKMRLVGSIEETEGLEKIAPGQRVEFTVDAFPDSTYEAVVEEVSPASNEAGVAFSISDRRPVKKFDVYMRIDPSRYPELKSGMSAKAWVHVK